MCECVAGWCYPEPTPGRENLKDHITFATGKGIAVTARNGIARAGKCTATARPGQLGRLPTAKAAAAAAAAAGPDTRAPPEGAGGNEDEDNAAHDSAAHLLAKPAALRSSSKSTTSEIPIPCEMAFGFDPRLLPARYLELLSDRAAHGAAGGQPEHFYRVSCHTNCQRTSQGT